MNQNTESSMRIFLTFCLLFWTSAWAFNLKPGLYHYEIKQKKDNGKILTRHYYVETPQHFSPNKKFPVVFFFHGENSHALSFKQAASNFIAHGRFVAIYPQGHHKIWNLDFDPSDANDLNFIQNIYQQMPMKNIDRKKIIAVGMSNGAGMVNKLLIHSTMFTGASLIASTLTKNDTPRPDSAIARIIQIHGEQDPRIPYIGGKSTTFLSFEETAQIWAKHNQCKKGTRGKSKSGNTILRFTKCQNDANVTFISCKRCKHHIPETFANGLLRYIFNELNI